MPPQATAEHFDIHFSRLRSVAPAAHRWSYLVFIVLQRTLLAQNANWAWIAVEFVPAKSELVDHASVMFTSAVPCPTSA